MLVDPTPPPREAVATALPSIRHATGASGRVGDAGAPALEPDASGAGSVVVVTATAGSPWSTTCCIETTFGSYEPSPEYDRAMTCVRVDSVSAANEAIPLARMTGTMSTPSTENVTGPVGVAVA